MARTNRSHRSRSRGHSSPSGRGRLVVLGSTLIVGAVVITWWIQSRQSSGTPGTELAAAEPATPVARLVARVVRVLPHDPEAYTQGLVWYRHKLYESTGHYGRSTLRRLDPETGVVEQQVALPAHLFGEGLARVGERLIQLTWREGKAMVYEIDGLRAVDAWRFEGEGWGLCFDGQRLVMSDGSSKLTFRDPSTFEQLEQVEVTLEGRPLANLNELECVDGWVYANVYLTETIVRVEPASGRVVALVDASGLLSAGERQAVEVLNGIAHDSSSGLLYLTGKYWPKMFVVELVPAG